MLEGFYTIASGMMMQQRTLDVLTNNIVNSQTPGFRASRVVSTTFEQTLARMEKQNNGAIGKGAPIRIVSEVPTKFDPNSLEETGRPYDIAINGEGYFSIRGDDGQEYLTRNGNFDVDEEGYLILRGNGRVLGRRGEIQLTTSDFTVEPDGDIIDPEGNVIDQLRVSMPADEAAMRRFPNGMYQSADMDANVRAKSTVVQGWSEQLTVDLNQEYTLVMEAQRAFQACSSALQIIDKINQKSSTQIAAI